MKNDEFGLFLDLQVFLFIYYYVNANALPIITFLNMLTCFVLPFR